LEKYEKGGGKKNDWGLMKIELTVSSEGASREKEKTPLQLSL